MRLPTPTAEMSVYRSTHLYYSAVAPTRMPTAMVLPAQLPACNTGALCSVRSPNGTQISVCDCPAGQACRPLCGRICEVDWFLCLFFPPIGCLPQCRPGICSIEGCCQ